MWGATDGNMIASDDYYAWPEADECSLCFEQFGLPQDGCVIKSQRYVDLCMECAEIADDGEGA